MSADPEWIHALMSDRNPYAYVHGMVTTAVDPQGLGDDDDDTGGTGAEQQASELNRVLQDSYQADLDSWQALDNSLVGQPAANGA